MKFLDKIFKSAQDPMLAKLEASTNLKFKEVFYSFGFVYTEENLKKFKECLEKDSLEEMSQISLFDVEQDNLEVYFVTDFFEKKSSILLIDYYEFLSKESILEQIQLEKFPNVKMKKLK